MAQKSTQSPVSNVTQTVLCNLEDQHDWVSLEVHHTSGQRPLIKGRPPRCLYIHPDDQIAALNHEHATGERLYQAPEPEWVLPVHITEHWTLGRIAQVFDSVSHTGPRAKRIVLGTVQTDSTVVYYFFHEGLVKPRQN
jgi:tRNA-splicing endonuclease subunit Sen15